MFEDVIKKSKSWVDKARNVVHDVRDYLHKLKVAVALKPSLITALPIYQKILGATAIENGLLIWEKLPIYTIPNLDDTLWVMRAGLARFVRVTTKENTGKVIVKVIKK